MIFKKIKVYSRYLRSHYRTVYENIARVHQVSPVHVYLLAHGERARNERDNRILQDILDEGIIFGIK